MDIINYMHVWINISGRDFFTLKLKKSTRMIEIIKNIIKLKLKLQYIYLQYTTLITKILSKFNFGTLAILSNLSNIMLKHTIFILFIFEMNFKFIYH